MGNETLAWLQTKKEGKVFACPEVLSIIACGRGCSLFFSYFLLTNQHDCATVSLNKNQTVS